MYQLQRDFSAVNENILYLRETPLWTVELFCLLQELDVHCVMLTQHAGFTPSHSDISWYSENLTENESERVTACFAFAREKDWNVLQVITYSISCLWVYYYERKTVKVCWYML